MASTHNYPNYFPYFPLPPPPPHHSSYPPPSFTPSPPHHISNPPPLPPPAAKPPSRSTPPHPFSPPPPPHVIPSPPPLPPPGHHSTVIVIVFVSLGGLLFLALLSVALCCFIKKRKKKTVQETDIIKIDEHIKVQEAILPGPHGPQVVVLSIEKDEHIQEEIKRNETVADKGGLHIKSSESEHHPHEPHLLGTTSTSSPIQHHPDHKSP